MAGWQRNGLFVTGTDTDVGKTQVTAGLALALREYCSVGLWKPVQSGVELGSAYSDSYRLWAGSGADGAESDLVEGTFAWPLAPWMAARRVGREISYEQLVQIGERRMGEHDVLLVEGAGGVAVPLTAERMVIDLMADLQLPAVVVARTGLGTVNHTLLTVEALRRRELDVLGVILNDVPKPADAQMIAENVEMIERFGDVRVLGVLPWLEAATEERRDWAAWREQWKQIFLQRMNMEPIIDGLNLRRNER
jgi:dethiobiotin synthetase